MYRSLVSPPIHRLRLEICAVAPTPAATRLAKRILEVFQAFRCILPLGYPPHDSLQRCEWSSRWLLELELCATMGRIILLNRRDVKSKGNINCSDNSSRLGHRF